MFPYMLEKGDAGSYRTAYEHALKGFSSREPQQMAQNSGTEYNPEKSVFTLRSLGQELDIHYPEGEIRFRGSAFIPLWSWRMIILNHLARADAAPLTGNLISFRETEGGNVFNSAFLRMNIQPLVSHLSDKPEEQIRSVCLALGGELEKGADVCAVFRFLPRFPITLKIWLKDDELDGSCNLLFDAGANHYLHTEDIVVASSILVDSLIKHYALLYP